MASDGDEMRDLVLDDCRDKMRKAVAHLQEEFGGGAHRPRDARRWSRS